MEHHRRKCESLPENIVLGEDSVYREIKKDCAIYIWTYVLADETLNFKVGVSPEHLILKD
ncbi:hypothetical protein LDENG_00267440 [Lucifuga dentata]|nr:hypothetical protein LDENG_00267440 [Lucifuga dentata]